MQILVPQTSSVNKNTSLMRTTRNRKYNFRVSLLSMFCVKRELFTRIS